MQIYLARNNQQAGPYTLEQVNAMLANTQVVLTDLAWHEGMSTWLPIGQLTGGKLVYNPSIKPASPTAAVDLTAQASSNIRYTESTINLNKVLTNATTLASVGQRVGAAVIDFLLLYFTMQIVFSMSMSPEAITALQAKNSALLAGLMSNNPQDTTAFLHSFWNSFPAEVLRNIIIVFVLVTLVQVVLIAKYGQTIGKMLLKIKIVDGTTFEKTTPFRSVLLRSVLFKYIGYNAIGPLLLIADFCFLFTDQKRSLHDRLAKTVVIKVPAVPYEKPKV